MTRLLLAAASFAVGAVGVLIGVAYGAESADKSHYYLQTAGRR